MNKNLPAILGSVLLVALPGFMVSDTPTDELPPWGLHIVFFSVGQADAVALLAPDGQACIIDAGHGSTAAGRIADFLLDAELFQVDDLKPQVNY